MRSAWSSAMSRASARVAATKDSQFGASSRIAARISSDGEGGLPALVVAGEREWDAGQRREDEVELRVALDGDVRAHLQHVVRLRAGDGGPTRLDDAGLFHRDLRELPAEVLLVIDVDRR